jgi:hypothetical protein
MKNRVLIVCFVGLACAAAAYGDDEPRPGGTADSAPIADPSQVGGEDASIVQVANLIYARVKSSKCFSDHFLVRADNESAISTSRRFHAVKLESDDVFQFPFVIMTGEGSFKMTDKERANLKQYCENGGFLLASAGCSSEEWDKSFRAELKQMWPDVELQPLPLSHAVFHTVSDIKDIRTKHGKPRPIEGISYNGKLVLIYSRDGLNNTANVRGCCCCGGNEIANAEEINVNILAYALAF